MENNQNETVNPNAPTVEPVGTDVLTAARAEAAAVIANKPSMTSVRRATDGKSTSLAATRTFVATVAEVSQEIERNGRVFRMVTLIDEAGQSQVYPVGEKFYNLNVNKIAPDVTLVVTITETVADRTHYKDNKTGELIIHNSTGESISNVTTATSQQGKIAFADILAKKLEVLEARPNLLAATANLYGNLLR